MSTYLLQKTKNKSPWRNALPRKGKTLLSQATLPIPVPTSTFTSQSFATYDLSFPFPYSRGNPRRLQVHQQSCVPQAAQTHEEPPTEGSVDGCVDREKHTQTEKELSMKLICY
ncbi:unnamed protein product [Vicia faba]|uniref:Uncharacterized protein n=1 Tax=Vicia faba TaxID=3906 RepID=A0AAV0ZBV2_VICFA|nr:unnamed protein product [Vicia faba]